MKKTTFFILICLFLAAAAAVYFIFLRPKPEISSAQIKSAQKLFGLSLTSEERKMMIPGLEQYKSAYAALRAADIPNHVPPALYFDPVPAGLHSRHEEQTFVFDPEIPAEMPENFEDLAFYPVSSLARLIYQKKITSIQLTQLYLDRLRKYGDDLECVITLTENLALQQAEKADREINAGRWRGPLHGIPWGAKDLLAAKGIRTTWGAMPYKDQIPDYDATVVKRLEEAGAVLIAKLSMGALAMGNVWFGGNTRTPWDLEQGSGGSSAGPGAATAAGLVGFSIGTETHGSILSPSTRCGVTGLRPTFGRVSRYGAMALSWSMDKIGPICRSAHDCALVFQAIYGPDGKDLSVKNVPFNWNPERALSGLRIGYLKSAFDRTEENTQNEEAVLDVFRSLGVKLIPFSLPDMPVNAMRFILVAEAAAAFDSLTRSGKDNLLVRQTRGSWPNLFRQARMIPAVEYIQANRLRTLLLQKMAEKMEEVDLYVAPSFSGSPNLLLTNLTGNPAVVVPIGFDDEGHPLSISFIGNLYQEGRILRAAYIYQQETSFHQQHPDMKKHIQKRRE
jgi:Asp-tRNA(Asn)/Glu-tRNA(Gln) amidotransferase A subunit family amidase